MAISPKPVDNGERFVAQYTYTNNHRQQASGVLGYFDNEKDATDMATKWQKHQNINSTRVVDRGANEEDEDNGSNSRE